MLLLVPSMAQAQLTAPQEAAQIELGPVSLYPTLQLVDAGTDSNVFNDGQNPQDDYTMTIASRAFVVTHLGLNELMFSTGGDYVWFQRFVSERSTNAYYAVRFNLSASRFKPFVGGERKRLRSRPDAEIDVRAERLERNAVVGANFNLSERTAITASAKIDESSYDEGQRFRGADLRQSLNRTGRSYSGGVRYALTPLTTMVVAGGYGEDTFPVSHTRDAKRYTATDSVEFSPDASIRGIATVGVEQFKPLDPTVGTYTGVTVNAGVNWLLWGRTSFDVKGGRNVSYSYKETEPFYISTSGRLTISHRIVGPLELVGTVAQELLSYRFHSGAPSIAEFTPHDVTASVVAGGVGIPLGHGFKITMSAERTRRHSAVDIGENYTRTRLLSTVTVGS